MSNPLKTTLIVAMVGMVSGLKAQDTTVYKQIKCTYYVVDSIMRYRYEAAEITMILTYKKGKEPEFELRNGKLEFIGSVKFYHNNKQIYPIEIK